MHKKLLNIIFASTIFMISYITISNVFTTIMISGIYGFIGVFELIDVLDITNFYFTVDSDSVIDTEILARRIGSGLATAGLGGVGTGIGLVFSGLIKGFSWNPSLKGDLFSYAIFGFALTEAIGLFALMMAFMLLYA